MTSDGSGGGGNEISAIVSATRDLSPRSSGYLDNHSFYSAAFGAFKLRMAKRADLGIFIDAVLAMVEPVETHFMWRPQLRDPAHEMVLEAAVNKGSK
jgi:hypothetical protein